MSYTPTEWESTDVVTATRLNALEQAVGDMNMSYTPNVWQNGDILSAAKMNALEQAVASGGGGSSDFTTVELVFTNNTEDTPQATLIFATGSYIVDGTMYGMDSLFYSGTLIIPLYQGSNVWNIPDRTNYDRLTTTGGVVIDLDEDTITFTGDCTITLT